MEQKGKFDFDCLKKAEEEVAKQHCINLTSNRIVETTEKELTYLLLTTIIMTTHSVICRDRQKGSHLDY